MSTGFRLAASTSLCLLTLGLAAGCGSSATTSTATSPTSINRCAVTANGGGQLPAAGGGGSVAVSAARECVWAATADGQWLTIRAGANGQGDGSVEYAAAANPDPAVRRGAIVLNEQRVEVTQAAGECRYSLSEPSGDFPQAGGAGQFEVRASSSLCAWTAQSDASWLTLRAGASSRGTATVQFQVSAASGQPRTGTIAAAGLRFTVTQAATPTPTPTPTPAPGCSYSLSAASAALPPEGGAGSVAVNTAAGCAWTATTNASWLTVTSGASGNGPGNVGFAASAQPGGGSRSGALTIAGHVFTVTQAAGCTFSIAPEVQNIDAERNEFNVTVTSSQGCGWTAASNAPWFTLRESGGTGSGQVRVTVAENPGPARSGTATIAGRTLTINQAVQACSYRVDPLEVKLDEDRRLAKIEVRTGNNCGWTAVSNTPWIAVVLNPSGTGNGDVWIGVGEGDGKNRTGTVTVAGQTVTVQQKDK